MEGEDKVDEQITLKQENDVNELVDEMDKDGDQSELKRYKQEKHPKFIDEPNHAMEEIHVVELNLGQNETQVEEQNLVKEITHVEDQNLGENETEVEEQSLRENETHFEDKDSGKLR